MNLKNIKHLIFDLGGVIININPDATFEGLAVAGQMSASKIKEQMYSSSIFTAFECGELSAAGFRSALREQLKINLSDEAIDEIWNRMLVDIPIARIELLKKLRPDFGMYALSNTNEIHVEAFNKIVQATTGQPSLDSFFDRVYFSHDLRTRKPEPEIYEQVLALNNLNANEVLFLDDRSENLLSAATLGLQTFEVKEPELLFELFADWMK